ncbi:hypothetical protein [Anatilimnocola floriformis]|uniref:hypothetical protein n=1 Tax=Anatilimnocola floriformis TaxID=2948575 RepID=UPI0020C4BBCB|nr:hypothetical protein [Anatilimnocola floriformis]
MIKFLCPNGHQLSAPDHMAGKGGKCPKCATAFVIPTLEELNEGAPAPESGDASQPNEADRMPPGKLPPLDPMPGPTSDAGNGGQSDVGKSGVVGGSRIGTESTKSSVKPGVFVFLCPNGHKLNGPPSLKGKAGQCPHCGARFMIPEDDVPEEDIPTGEVEDDDVPSGDPVEDEMSLGPETAEEEVVEATVEEIEPDPEPIPPGVHALGYIVGRLWDHKNDTTELEIFLQEGEIISPDHYAEILSTGEYGVFAHKDNDEEYSLSVIPWTAVRRVDLRKVTKLASGTFR